MSNSQQHRIPLDGDDDEQQQLLSQLVENSKIGANNEEEKSVASQSTYGPRQNDRETPILINSSNVKVSSSSKRVARKSPPGFGHERDPTLAAASLLVEGMPDDSKSLRLPPLLQLGSVGDSRFTDASMDQVIFNRTIGIGSGNHTSGNDDQKNTFPPFSNQRLQQQRQQQQQHFRTGQLSEYNQPSVQQPKGPTDSPFDITTILSQASITSGSGPSGVSSLTDSHRIHNISIASRGPSGISSLTDSQRIRSNMPMHASQQPNVVPNNASNLSSMDGNSSAGGGGGGVAAYTGRGGNPRSILNERYQQDLNRSFTKSDFVSIRDTSRGDHNPHFTAAFVCPETGECFLSGDLIAATPPIVTTTATATTTGDVLNWYGTKKMAEFAAAGRAEDIARFRSSNNSTGNAAPQHQFCKEAPYFMIEPDLSLFLQTSRALDDTVAQKITELKTKAGIPGL